MARIFKILRILLLLVVASLGIFALVISHDSACGDAPAIGDGVQRMKALTYRCYGPPEVLKLEEIAKPVPNDDQVLVKVHAASVNPLDWHYLRGTPYFMRMGSGIGAPADPQLGVDFAGVIESVGRNVRSFKPGDAVFGGADGAFAEYVVIRDSRALALKPENLSFEQAASIPIAASTALQALRDEGQIRTGQKILINGASGGVGTFAVQIARSLGAEVTGVCSTRNLELVRSLGADHVIDYTREDFTEGEIRYDLIVDLVGNHGVLDLRHVLKADGRLVIVGGPDGNWFGPMSSAISALLVSPFVRQEMGMMLARLDPEDLKVLSEMVIAGNLTPVIDRSYPFDEIPDAIRDVEAGHARGKVVISMNSAQASEAPQH